MAQLELARISKSYGALKVLNDISLSVADGEFVVLVGPSGCGKSTLLRMIAGLEDISAGDLLIGGTRANAIPPQKRDIAMVFQSYALFPHMNVGKNIGFGPRIRGESPDATQQKVDRAADVVNLGAYLDRLPGQLSGGQRQRVAMGRSIVRDPQVFLFDEPLSNLDAKLRLEMRTEIKALHQKFRTTTVYVTHDQIEAMTMADRIVVMNGGKIEQEGAPLELYDRPANMFVAGFLGSPAMDFLDAEYDPDGPSLTFASGAALPCPRLRNVQREPVKVGIRPERHRIDPDGPLTLSIDVIEPTGAETHVYGTIEGQTVRCVFRERLSVKPGDTLRLSVDPEALHVFERKDGGRLSS
ncbi:ABC transporter ATP-binding protein [Oceaniglobus trochenteri]|uniref:ABC transporter ATP-binding protein n=1 Tax=Oceaniglobus trochenteri TaxID=2763260 RepID=UPI001CFF822C|nr:sn-glycerol-3-phosphate ABC transporter ATP-binding protein UgpC [Oceaniglobus trochenteri]